MPAIYLFQRRTLYGGDDLHLLALVTAAVRVFQLACFAVLVYYILHHVQHNIMAMDSNHADDGNSSPTSTSITASRISSDPYVFHYNNVQNIHGNQGATTTIVHTENEFGNRRLLENTNNNNHQSNGIYHWGISLLEFAWMDAAVKTTNNDNLTVTMECSNSHLFPLLLMSFTAAGIVFGLGSLVMITTIYQTSSMGCPTMHRHPRTERMEQLLEWFFFPLNIIHFCIWVLGVSAMMMAHTYLPCEQSQGASSTGENPSTLLTVLWILSAILILISQAIEVFWNFAYVLALYYHDPHALVWNPTTPSSSHHGHGTLSQSVLPSYHSSSSLNNNSNNAMTMAADAAFQPPFVNDDELDHYRNHELVEQMWADRCHNCCRCLGIGTCFFFGGRELYGSGVMYYGDFARAMADYLETRGVLDIVPSDIIVGFLVLQQLQTQRRHKQRQQVLLEHSRVSLMYNPNSASSLLAEGTATAAAAAAATESLNAASLQLSKQKPQLHNHRANAKGSAPNGMQLQPRAPSSANATDLLSAPLFQPSSSPTSSQPQQQQQESSSESLLQPTIISTRSNATNGGGRSGRSVLLLSMGAGTMPNNDALTSSSPLPPRNIAGNGNSNHNHADLNHMNINSAARSNGAGIGVTPAGISDGVHMDHSLPPPRLGVSSRSLLDGGSGNNSSNNLNLNNNKGDSSSSSLASGRPNSFRNFQRVFSEQNHADVVVLEEGARYSKYALAIYTWYLYLYVHPITGIPRLCAKAWNTKTNHCSCCFSGGHYNNNNSGAATASGGISRSASSGSLHQSPSSSNMNSHAVPRLNNGHHDSFYNQHHRRHRWEGDNICQAHKNALLLTAGLENEADLVYVQLKNSFNENPYCILLDHETQAVVVAVRGTFSLEDCVTDVLIEPESLERLGDEFGFGDVAKGQYCHGGVLSCARNVYRDLKRHGSLEYLLETKYPHYQLRLVGHSLGAACSTLLGFMLRKTYPTLQCYNFSPPGCTLTWEMAIQCQPWCTSFVLDTELVPRLSFEALENLRDEVLELIGRIRVPKIEVARRVATKTLWCQRNNDGAPSSFERARNQFDIEQATASVDALDELLDDLLLPEDEMPPADSTSYREQLDQFQSIQSERRTSRGARRAIRMFPPGRILHLVKTDQEQSCMVQVAKCVTCCMSNAGSQYTPVWIGNGDLNEIVVSPTMGTDHFPDRMVTELHGILQNFGLAPPTA